MRYLLIVIGMVAINAILTLLSSIPVWMLWNWLMPEISGLKQISWLQALGITALCGLLFKLPISSSSK